jgi:hypothetical protein
MLTDYFHHYLVIQNMVERYFLVPELIGKVGGLLYVQHGMGRDEIL